MINTVYDSPLGQNTHYPRQYAPECLFAIERQHNRQLLGISEPLPFYGVDIWQEYELSWLNERGKPQVAMAQFIFPCTSPRLVESKSLKLYLHSLNAMPFANADAVMHTIQQDLRQCVADDVIVNIMPLHECQPYTLATVLKGINLDDQDIDIAIHQTLTPELLTTAPRWADETVYSHLLRSNCPVTGQPDWATVQISYCGQQVRHDNLLRYLISFREHAEFAENCVEHIYKDISDYCHPQTLTVRAFYTRRGGKDINPVRSSLPKFTTTFQRMLRQ